MGNHDSKLAATLRELRAELAATRPVDPETRQLVEQTVADLRDVLDASGGNATNKPSGVTDRLRTAAQHFEGTHPTLSTMIENAINLLTDFGL